MSLVFKPYEEMTAADYAAIGLKVGLEVHQQLLTRRKLFCRCPAGLYSPRFDAEILRHMRPTLSELGEYDGTALMEKKTRKNIYYRIHRDSVCTYEFDDTPPFMIDDEALDIALGVCHLMHLKIVGELHIARKQYLDGSIPTGFQRTGILGVDGWVPFGADRKIRIRQLSIEEDACREVSDIGHDRVYLTDRLGMPLIETVTEPDMCTPQEAAAVGQLLRRLVRSTGQMRTGYGAGRQDVNVSVTGGTRIEIKGTPQIWRNPHLIYNEARRQCSLLDIRRQLHERGVTAETLSWASEDVTRIVADTDYAPVRQALADGARVRCVLLKGFGALLREPTQEHTTFAKEFSDRVRVIACLTGTPNLIHSDAASESLAGREWKHLRRKLRAETGDTLLVVWGPELDTITAANEIAIRAREATLGVPADTRQAFKDGTNGFERVLPGADRMYPDTDLPPLAISQLRLDQLAAHLPEPIWERAARYRAFGVPAQYIDRLTLIPQAPLFDRLVQELQIDATLAAVVLVEHLKALARVRLHPERLSDDDLWRVFQAHAQHQLTRAGVRFALTELAAARLAAEDIARAERQVAGRRRRGGQFAWALHHRPPAKGAGPDLTAILERAGLGAVDDATLRRAVEQEVRVAQDIEFHTDAARRRHLIGRTVVRLQRRVAGRDVQRVLAAVLPVTEPNGTRTETQA